MLEITKKCFIEMLINNRSEFLAGGYIRDMEVGDILEHLTTPEFNAIKGDIRQGFKHSKGLKFLKGDGTYSYADNLVNYDYYQFNDILVAVSKQDESVSLLVYRVI